MKKNNILMLWPVKKDYWPRAIEKENLVVVESTFKKMSFWGNVIRKIIVTYTLFLFPFLEKWKNDIDKYDVIIVQAARVTANIPKWLRKKGYKGRIIYWYWDPVSGSVNPNKVDLNACEIWSFDPKDCNKYNLKYNDTYYPIDERDLTNIDDREIYDVSYVGRDKGRIKELRKIESFFCDKGLQTYFYIVATKPYYLSAKKLMPPINYINVLRIINNSKAILDINQKEQSGLSMRCMESLFFNKKLITNNRYIKTYDWYCPENIYILGEDKRTILQFLETPYCDKEEVKQQYKFKFWLNKFFD